MFIDNVIKESNADLAHGSNTTKPWERELLLRLLDNRNGWKLLVVYPGKGDELPMVAHMLGSKGEMVVMDTDAAVCDQFKTNKQNGLYTTKSTASLTMNGPYKRNATVQAAVSVQQFDGASLDFSDDYFDAIWCPSDRLAQSSSCYGTLVDEFYRVVRPGGFVVMKQPVFQVA